MKIAITGGIGSGKSFVCQLFSQHGISIYDCDDAAKRLMRQSASLRQRIMEAVGQRAYDADGKLNKAEVTRFLLQSEAHAQTLNAIIHPAVADDFRQSGYTWMECAILFESGFDQLVDRVIVVTAPQQLRLQRIMERDHISAEKAMEWMDKQWNQELVRQRADFEIVNDGRPLAPQIEQILKELSAERV